MHLAQGYDLALHQTHHPTVRSPRWPSRRSPGSRGELRAVPFRAEPFATRTILTSSPGSASPAWSNDALDAGCPRGTLGPDQDAGRRSRKRQITSRAHDAPMGTRSSPVFVGADRARHVVAELTSELRRTRVDRGLSQTAAGRAVGLSGPQVSRIERGLSPDVSIRVLCRLLAVVGLELSARAYPAGEPVRDRAHSAVLARFRGRLHRSLRWRTEVPLPITGDLRAWDGHVAGSGWRVVVEAETRPTDLQALERRLTLKLRDGGVDTVILVLPDTRHNRALLRGHGAELVQTFPIPGRRAMELLAAGAHPGGSSVVML